MSAFVYRIDHHGDLLIIGYPISPGHEVLADIFHRISSHGQSYPKERYNGSRIAQCGTADVPLTSGHKSPDFSLYEFKEIDTDNNVDGIDDDNSIPTVVYEYAYSQDSKKLALDAARHLLLSRGRVQLVVAINVERQKIDGNDTKKGLKRVTWSHWELDLSEDGWKEVLPSWDGVLNDPQPDRELNEDRIQPPADAFKAVIDMGEAKCHMRAVKVKEFVVPDCCLCIKL